ncbi:MAG: hypothetical protein HGA78_12520 [Nitrospirales bacterium]|nr:hypothetical protein [Nitrospirales bacterium]
MTIPVQLSDESIEWGMRLMEKSDDEILGYLGYLDGEQEVYRAWQEKKGVVLPEWDEEDLWLDFTSGAERGAVKDWLRAGSKAFKEKVLPLVKDAVCENGDCRKEIKELEGDAKSLLKYLAGNVICFVSASVPAAAVSIGVAVAALLIKRGLRDFCKE